MPNATFSLFSGGLTYLDESVKSGTSDKSSWASPVVPNVGVKRKTKPTFDYCNAAFGIDA